MQRGDKTKDREVNALVRFILNLKDFHVPEQRIMPYFHMGATICDSILQAGVRYDTVVKPRIKTLLEKYPEAKTTSAFWSLINRIDLKDLINWRHPEKPRRIRELTFFFLEEKVETEENLSEWIQKEENCYALLQIKGIGRKTVDYLKMLAGVPALAVDRHVRSFLKMAGIEKHDYEEIKRICEDAASILKVNPRVLDCAIWRYMRSIDKTKKQKRKSKTAPWLFKKQQKKRVS